MGRLDPPPLQTMSETTRRILEESAGSLGFVPRSALALAHRPDVLGALFALAKAINGPGRIDPMLKRLVALRASRAAGCDYQAAHSAFAADQRGAARVDIEAAWRGELDAFDPAARCALVFATRSAGPPGAVSDADVDALRVHFDEVQIAELAAVIALAAFLDRWSSMLGLSLEPLPAAMRYRMGEDAL